MSTDLFALKENILSHVLLWTFCGEEKHILISRFQDLKTFFFFSWNDSFIKLKKKAAFKKAALHSVIQMCSS